jgi:hypothetical protein
MDQAPMIDTVLNEFEQSIKTLFHKVCLFVRFILDTAYTHAGLQIQENLTFFPNSVIPPIV